MGHFQLFSMFFKFSMGHFLSIYTDFYGPFSKLMGLWCMAPCLPNHCLRHSRVDKQEKLTLPRQMFSDLHGFYAPGLKDPPGASSNWIACP